MHNISTMLAHTQDKGIDYNWDSSLKKSMA